MRIETKAIGGTGRHAFLNSPFVRHGCMIDICQRTGWREPGLQGANMRIRLKRGTDWWHQ